MRAARCLLWVLLCWVLTAAVVPDGRVGPRDQGAPPLPTAPGDGSGRSSPIPPPDVPLPRRSLPPSAAPTPSASADSGFDGTRRLPPVTSGPGSNNDLNEQSGQPLQPVSSIFQHSLPWPMLILCLVLLVGAVVVGLLMGRERPDQEFDSFE